MTVPRSIGVSVVIPARNEEKFIRECLLALVGQTRPAAEILVIDNASGDRTAEITRAIAAQFPASGIRLIPHPTPGLIGARNVGLDAATGDVIARIDADTTVEPTWAQTIADAVDRGADAVTGPAIYYDSRLPALSGRVDRTTRRWLRTTALPFLFGSNMALTRAAWHAIRDETCRDPDDRFHEDIDLAIHLHRSGHTIAYEPLMRAGVSARRTTDAWGPYARYLQRFNRTYRAHGMPTRPLVAVRVILTLGWLITHARVPHRRPDRHATGGRRGTLRSI